jgi:hypothetical protein
MVNEVQRVGISLRKTAHNRAPEKSRAARVKQRHTDFVCERVFTSNRKV